MLDRFLAEFCGIKTLSLDAMTQQAVAWLQELPEHIQTEIEGMAAGSGRTTETIATFLYADIARPGDGSPAAGPMCSAIVTDVGQDRGRNRWVARNTDWYPRLLMRGCEGVVHRTPNRIPVLALGVRGDIDIDTGCNAEKLWLHAHTLWLPPEPAPETSISWLFWLREALETCATIDQVESMLATVGRDRGIILIALDGKTGEAASFECGLLGAERRDLDHSMRPACLLATNHRQSRHPTDPGRLARSREGSTTRRLEALRTISSDHPPEHAPDDLIDMLATDTVEMRSPPMMRTIYSAVCQPAAGRCWFAKGTPGGKPAASTGEWLSVPWPF